MSKILFLAATHGNEGFSIPVLESLEKKYPKEKYGYDWVISNPLALKKDVRFIEADLNRSAPGDSKSKIYEERRASFLTSLSKKYSCVIDLHGTVASSGIVTIIPYPTMQNIMLASMVNTDRNIIWYSSKSAKKGPITQFTYCPGIEIECGPQNNPATARRLKKVLEEFIKNLKTPIMDNMKNIQDQKFYTVYGKREGNHNPNVKDFVLYKDGKESYYPFLSNQYPEVLCYKTKKFDLKEVLIYDS